MTSIEKRIGIMTGRGKIPERNGFLIYIFVKQMDVRNFFTTLHGNPTSKLLKNSVNSEGGPFYLNMKNQVCSLRE
jgi:hypothetical protein